jgi:DNA anti-recombination protein RmuC
MFILTLIVVACLIFITIKQKNDLENKINYVFNEQSKDFFQKIDFIFNRINQSKDDSHKQTIYALEPISKVMDHLKMKIEEFEKNRVGLEHHLKASFNGHFENLIRIQNNLLSETYNLKIETNKVVQALKKPSVRGKWGEIQLKRIAEITGMLPFCEFETQNTSFEGMRPDMSIRLPNGGYLFIDAKTPLEAYLEGIDSKNDDDSEFRKANLKAIKTHIYSLSNKKYWHRGNSPELVVMFIPIEALWISALEEEPSLMEYASDKNIIVSTPMTLIGLLKVIFFGWSQVHFAEEAENIKKTLREVLASIKQVSSNMQEAYKLHGTIETKMYNSIGILKNVFKTLEEKSTCISQPNIKENLMNNIKESTIKPNVENLKEESAVEIINDISILNNSDNFEFDSEHWQEKNNKPEAIILENLSTDHNNFIMINKDLRTEENNKNQDLNIHINYQDVKSILK